MWRQSGLTGSSDPAVYLGVGEMAKVEKEAWNSWMLSVTAPEGRWGLEVWLQVSKWDCDREIPQM